MMRGRKEEQDMEHNTLLCTADEVVGAIRGFPSRDITYLCSITMAATPAVSTAVFAARDGLFGTCYRGDPVGDIHLVPSDSEFIRLDKVSEDMSVKLK